jgi:acyl-CoA dehydrogenase
VNEVFLDNVRVPAANLVGAEGQGWSIAKFLLENERGGSTYGPALVADAARLRAVFEGLPTATDLLLRDRLAQIEQQAMALELTELRICAAMTAGDDPGPISLATKLIASEIRQALEQFGSEMLGDGRAGACPTTGRSALPRRGISTAVLGRCSAAPAKSSLA